MTATEIVLFCHRLLRLERKYQKLLASMLPEMTRTIVTKRRGEYLDFGLALKSQQRASGRSATSHITHIAHGAVIAREAVEPRDLIGRGQTLKESSARALQICHVGITG